MREGNGDQSILYEKIFSIKIAKNIYMYISQYSEFLLVSFPFNINKPQ